MNVREIKKIIEADGWVYKNSRGSHDHYVHPTKSGTYMNTYIEKHGLSLSKIAQDAISAKMQA